MYLYLDESGDLGFDFDNKKPSPYFVITLLVCDNKETSIIIKKAVERTLKNKIHQKNKYKNNHELKGGLPINVKKYFYKNIECSDSWKIYSIILDKKTALKKLPVPIDTHRVYNLLANHLLKQVDFSEIKTVNLFVDRSKDRNGINEFDTMLQINLGTILPLNVGLHIRHVSSHESYGIQAVDLFCWGVFRKYTCNDEEWYDMFKHKIVYEQRWLK